MDREELLDRLEGTETEDFEVKAAATQVPDDAYKTVSAFANTSGGWLVFGIREKGKRFEISGVDDPDRLQNDFLTTCRSGLKLSRRIDVKAKLLTLDEARILAFYVAELPRFDKPLKVRVKKEWQTFIRLGSGDHRCSEAEEARFLRDASYDNFDSTICADANVEDLDVAAIQWFQKQISPENPSAHASEANINQFLSGIGLLREGGLTLAAALLFGQDRLIARYKAVGIVDFRLLHSPWEERDVAASERRWDDRIFCEHHLIDALRSLLDRFWQLCPRPFELEPNGVQHRAESLDFLAVREALVNLLAHQDYTDQTRVARILWYSDRVIFDNPGDSFLSEKDMLAGGMSNPRNPLLLRVFRQTRFAEQAGTGIPKIFQRWREAGRPEPILENDPGRKLYRLILPWSLLPPQKVRVPLPQISLAKLPATGDHFVARETELARLDAAWDDPSTNVIVLVAVGGVGKSALVNHWLDRLAEHGWRGAERVLGWSFYSQGTEATGASGDRFVDHALGWLGYEGKPITSSWDKGQELARQVRAARTLLVLDGLERLQYPPGVQTGRLKDPAMQALLRELQAENAGLCVITTRIAVADISGRAGVVTVDLATLPREAGAELLAELGVVGKRAELEAAATEFGGHALALTLLGTYLRDVCDGDVRRRKEVPLLKEGFEGRAHARRVMLSYETWLGDGPELQVLRLVGLFDRPAEAAAVAALRTEPIAGLSEGLGATEETRWKQAVARLVRAGLVSEQGGGLDAHPLVREHFGERLREQAPEAWEAGHTRLYEHYRQAAPELPETLEAMLPLYTAVVHGCRAGRVQEAFDEVYRRRIQRGKEHYSTSKLGAFGAELTALAAFFDRPWSQPSSRLKAADQAWILNEAGFVLRALGRLPEAAEPMRAGLEARIVAKSWKQATISAGNLSELRLMLGEVAAAVEAGAESVELADRSGDAFIRIYNRTIQADTLHQAGRWEESAAVFGEAERMQAENQPEYPWLHSLAGYRYCDLLLGRAEPEDGSGLDGVDGRYRGACEEVRERATQTLVWARESGAALLDLALDHLTLGRAHVGLALTSPAPDFTAAAEYLSQAVAGLRRAANASYLPLGLFARATLHRLQGNRNAARADLTEAEDIAVRGHMRLHEADAHLEWTRLCLTSNDLEAARAHLAAARALVDATGYGRRRREVEWLERACQSS